MRPADKARLVRAALQARKKAVAPYSRFRVGAAILARGGKIITGCNVESASFGLTCCAERVALFKALSEGQTSFAAMAVAARHPGGPMPCGACRQLLAEYAPGTTVIVVDSRQPTRRREFAVADLLPGAFVGFAPE